MKKVIERIVESEGAPNENDLWLNGTTLKKFQNGEWTVISGGGGGDSPSGSMGEDEEYTIAQALNDLNERIAELRSQVAQQDDLRIVIDQPQVLTADEKEQLIDAHERGVLMDVLLVLNGGDTIARVITDNISGDDAVFIFYDGAITTLDVSE